MNNSPPPIIAFELGVGEFRIVTQEAVYQIKVCPDLVEVTRPGEAPGGIPVKAEGNAFFQELSQELFDKVGRLARQLSVSVEELPSDAPAGALGDTDQQLEHAKGQLEEVIDLTEKASMSIMDSADEIQDQLTRLRDQMDLLKGLDIMADADAGPGAAPAAGSPFQEKLAEINAILDRLLGVGPDEQAPAAPVPEAAPAPEAIPVAPPPAAEAPAPKATAGEKVTVIHFDVEVVFQTLYELCTNEAVKDHIRVMREAQATDFDGLEISAKLTEMAAGVEVEDGFYNFPIPGVLKIIYGATTSEEYRTILKKMNQTVASIFLDNVLPVEGETMEIEATEALAELASEAEPVPAPEPAPAAEPVPVVEPVPAPEPVPAAEPAPAAGSVQDELRTLRALTAELDDLARSGQAAPAEGGAYTSILTRDRDTIVQTVSQANELIHKTGRHLNRILETLSFQDLSGQRIKRVVALMGDIQTQLLSILVSVDAKLKVHQANEGQAPEKTEKMAQDEVDKALEKLSAAGPSELLGPGAENRLNQGAVNDLLAQLGF
ncbi:MAG: protein phosphatase CheZ [Candidatus Adiutrix sp.]|jgi:chemotaxis regulatin CheY-phosphate phosphatase CheZ|nr:protein phosphatase CheZ [Candidatus Adiutrix sp.]